MIHYCPKCTSTDIIKNGNTYHKKARLKCKDCNHQFSIGITKKYIDEGTQSTVRRLLLEKIPLAGIQRAVLVSKSWLFKFIKKEYANIPADLNVVSKLPDLGDLEAANMNEAIEFEKKNFNRNRTER